MLTIASRLEDALSPELPELRAIEIFSDLSDENLAWLASRMKAGNLAKDEIVIHQGEPADHLFVLLSGELQVDLPDGRTYVVHAGQVTGMLPFSRLTHFASDIRAAAPSRYVALSKNFFPEMLAQIPVLQQRLVSVLADRIREATAASQQREKMMALGRLSAGLAHELNNPASAAQRAAHNLREAWETGRSAALALDQQGLPAASRIFLAELELDWLHGVGPQAALDTLDRSEREEELVSWLQNHGVEQPWNLATSLVDLGCTIDVVNTIAQRVPPEFLNHVLIRITASLSITRLANEIESSSGRISELVQAIKEYSYMDRMPQQEIDLHAGIETTLIMLRHRLKSGVQLIRDYDRSLPKISARGSELNQIWTNLIVNALDAMDGKGKLTVRTSRDHAFACVEIVDDGPGIPSETQSHIMEPFFTTKPVGQGTGLGLDTAFRIARNHGGSLTFTSRPGETRFIVRLPLPPNAAASPSP